MKLMSASSISSNSLKEVAAPHLLLVFEQHEGPTIALREAFACLFLSHLYAACDLPHDIVARLPKDIAACFGPAGFRYAQRRLFAWSSEAWKSVLEFKLSAS